MTGNLRSSNGRGGATLAGRATRRDFSALDDGPPAAAGDPRPGDLRLDDLAPYFLTLRDVTPAPFQRGALFGNEHPVEVEVGTGRGLFLVNAATTTPGTNFLGVEYDFKEARRAARRLQKRELGNVRVLGADANVVLRQYLPDGYAKALHVYFPDPWWKRRHKRRRIINPEFLDQAARILEPGGLLHAWTDVEEYFGVMTALVAANPAFSPRPAPAERPAGHDMDYHTSFERKKRKLGLMIFRALWERREPLAS